MSEFTCVICEKTFIENSDEQWNDFKAAEEFINRFPGSKNSETDYACEPCYKSFLMIVKTFTDEEKAQLGMFVK